jgi:hypothetical protein
MWSRLRRSGMRGSRLARPLREAYRAGVLEAARWEDHVRRALLLLRAAGVEPLLIKGLASALPYAEMALRPCTDIDLCVRPEQLPTAQSALRGSNLSVLIDLHAGIPDLPDREWIEVFDRSRTFSLRDVEPRIPGAEDHLRLLCYHFVRHSGCRPLWLCDIAAAMEALPDDFDWDYFLAGNERLSDWVRCVIGLSGRGLGARLPQPAETWNERVPSWMERTVLWRWGSGLRCRSLSYYLWQPVGAFQGLRYHGFNAIRGVFQLGLSPMTRWPIPFLQVGGGMVVSLLRKYARWQRRGMSDPGFVPVHRPLARLALARYGAKAAFSDASPRSSG